MRLSAVTSLTTHNAVTASFTLLSGEDLALVFTGTGTCSMIIEYQGEGLTGSPFVVYSPTSLANTSGLVVYTNLPRGNYRVRMSAWTSGSREVQFLAS